MFDDQGIERSKIIVPTVTQAIRESRISIIVLSKKYAFSSWCLDVLLEIMKRKEDIEQIVMSVFYGVDPSDVLKQTGNFGIAFNETCARKTEEEQRKWSQALTYVGHIAGEHFQNWDNEAKMIEKIASDCEYVILNHSRLCLMASSYSSPCTWHYNVFTSFSGLDIRKTFLSHLRKQFNFNGITMFDDQGMERSQIIAPALTQAIRESRISIIVLPMNFASSSWCLDELLEILKCKEDKGQIVMSVFYGVDPSDVRKQTGDFGTAFNETCARKTRDAEKMEPSFDLCGQHAEEHFQNWENEAEMIEKIARDVLDKLNATPCRDFDGMVGLDDHLKEISVPKVQQCFIIENLPLRRLLGKSVARYAIAKKTRFACIQSILLRRSHSPLNREYLMPVGYSFKLFVEPHDHDMIIRPQ